MCVTKLIVETRRRGVISRPRQLAQEPLHSLLQDLSWDEIAKVVLSSQRLLGDARDRVGHGNTEMGACKNMGD